MGNSDWQSDNLKFWGVGVFAKSTTGRQLRIKDLLHFCRGYKFATTSSCPNLICLACRICTRRSPFHILALGCWRPCFSIDTLLVFPKMRKVLSESLAVSPSSRPGHSSLYLGIFASDPRPQLNSTSFKYQPEVLFLCIFGPGLNYWRSAQCDCLMWRGGAKSIL